MLQYDMPFMIRRSVEFCEIVNVHDLSREIYQLTCDLFLQSFFRKHAPSEKGPYGISSEVMDTYVKSCGEIYSCLSCLKGSSFNC